MKTIVPVSDIVWYDNFPWQNTYKESFLRSLLFGICIPEECEDDHIVVLDYDGLVEWFNEWSKDDEIWHDSTLDEYLPHHMNVAGFIEPIKEVRT